MAALPKTGNPLEASGLMLLISGMMLAAFATLSRKFVREIIKPCSWHEMPEFPIKSLYTLVTCSYEVNDARTFLFAVEVDEGGNIIK